MMAHRGRTLGLAAALLSCGPTMRAHSNEIGGTDGRQAWTTMLHDLPGGWMASTAGGAHVPVSFRTIAHGSVLIETFGASGRETMTAYHLDGSTLMATHYCAQGNQPRLRADVDVHDATHVTFRYFDATDVGTDEAVLVELEYRFRRGGFERTETYRQANGTLERTAWRFATEDAWPR